DSRCVHRRRCAVRHRRRVLDSGQVLKFVVRGGPHGPLRTSSEALASHRFFSLSPSVLATDFHSDIRCARSSTPPLCFFSPLRRHSPLQKRVGRSTCWTRTTA